MPRPTASAAEAAAPSLPPWTARDTDVPREGAPRLLSAVRVAENPGFDRIVFDFDDGVPGYHLEYIDKPVRDCGAGDVRPIEGDAWLEIRFTPANAHTEQGEPTIRERELFPHRRVVRELERTCDFEAVVTWVAGVAAPQRYRVFQLEAPPRLVVDLQH